MNSETVRIAEALATAIASLGKVDMICAMRAAWSLALACSRKAGGVDIDTASAFLMDACGWNEEAAVAAVRYAGARWREHNASKIRITQKGSPS